MRCINNMSKKKQLLFRLTRKDFVIEPKVGHGKGGQNRNRRKTACRIYHPASGAEGNCQEQRYYKQNERTAFLRLIKTMKFKIWHNKMCMEKLGILKKIEDEVEKMMRPENILVEVQKDGLWVPETK